MSVVPKVRQIDIAKRVGVSQAAVSFVLNGSASKSDRIGPELRERIEKAATELNYRPNQIARQLRGGRSGLIGVLIDSGAPPVFFERITCLEREAQRRGYRILVGQISVGGNNISDYIEDFLSRGVDGAVCLSTVGREQLTGNADVASRLRNVVFLRRPPSSSDALYVDIDAGHGIAQVVAHLASQGRRKIAIQLVNAVQAAHVDRHQSYLRSLQIHGLELDSHLVWVGDNDAHPATQTASRAIVDVVVEQFIDSGQADAVIAINDDWAALMLKALRRRGLRIPEDVAVVGQGNFKTATLVDPELTTVDPCNEQFGQAAIELLVKQIEDDTSDRSDEMPSIQPKLIVRESA